MPSLVVNDEGVELHYYDSGASNVAAGLPYKTLFVVHGLGFNGCIYKKVQALGHNAGLRIVAINRRCYAGSTPLPCAEHTVMTAGGTDKEKEAFLVARGLEIASFMDIFIQRHDVPPISEDGKNGGIGLLGWSYGNTVTLSALANLDKLPSEVQTRLARYMRALIIDEPPSMAVGYPLGEGCWLSFIDPLLSDDDKYLFHCSYITSYFDHGDLSKRDPKLLSRSAPSLFRRLTVYGMTARDIADVADYNVREAPLLLLSIPQHLVAFRKVCFDPATRALLQRMKIWAIVGDSSVACVFPAWWSMQDEDKAHGGGFINFKMIAGVNHLIQWDDPDKALMNYLEAMA